MKNYEFFSLDSNFELARSIASSFAKSLHVVRVDRFADSEVQIVLPESVMLSGKTILIILFPQLYLTPKL